ncbi:putative membrane domain protein [Burkholderia sp. ABCPW 111]|nr:putative membrane domain protein [Burkholderia sp. ABCPW 111]
MRAMGLVAALVCSLSIEGAAAGVAEDNVLRAARAMPERSAAADCRQWAQPVPIHAQDGASSGWVRALVAMAAYNAAAASSTPRSRETARSLCDEHRAAMFSSEHYMFAPPTMAR